MTYPIENLNSFPTQPGVYLMLGRNKEVLYVGKARNLRQRVRQYFLPGRDGREMVPYLVSRVESIDTIVVASEKEALLLENTLIKQHKPRFNALFKDDKTYTALKINSKHEWPMLSLVRFRGAPKPDGLYFGPYTSAQAARQTLDLLNRMFPLRQCSDQELARRTRPCILYDMKRCIAPCVQRCTKEEYQGYVKRTINFLKGKDQEVLKELKQEREEAAGELQFERAATLHRVIQQIEQTLEGQNVDRFLGADADVLGIFREGDEVMLVQLIVRGGKLTGSRSFDFSKIAEEDSELLESFILQRYENQMELPDEILLPVPIADPDALAEILSKDKRKIQIFAPQRGGKKALVEIAQANAEAGFKKEKDAAAILEKTLLEMQEKLHLTRYPRTIECFDNSSISGTSVVSTLVVFTNGAKDGAKYRKYKIRSETGADDYAAMKEVLERRYLRAKQENALPDLIIIDGGKGHLNIAVKVLQELNIVSVDLISLAKEMGRHDKGATIEQIFLPNVKDPIRLKPTSPVLFLLQRIRDEAHRTAITYHRKLRVKKHVQSRVADIPGIGPVKTKLLLKQFGSLKGLMNCSEEELKAVPGLSEANRAAILSYVLKYRVSD
jgi:excinuclease ABC subunit C